jgi:nucleoside-diphosphate-sugar epimerase
MNMEQIESLLITGSNGFVGQSFLDYLSSLPAQNIPKELYLANRSPIVDRQTKRLNYTKIHQIEVDLVEPWKFDFKVSHILNLAADGSKSSYSSESAQNFGKIGENLSRWIKQSTPKVLVHASSGACFGLEPINLNDDVYQDKSEFIKSRLESEECITSSCNEINVRNVVARLFTFIGPQLLNKKQYAISSFIYDAVNNGLINVKGNKDTIRSYMHESTMSMWLYNCLINSSAKNIVSIGSSDPVTIAELAEYISKLTGAVINYMYPNAPGDRYVAINAREKQFLDLDEGVNWRQSVQECINLLESRKSD